MHGRAVNHGAGRRQIQIRSLDAYPRLARGMFRPDGSRQPRTLSAAPSCEIRAKKDAKSYRTAAMSLQLTETVTHGSQMPSRLPFYTPADVFSVRAFSTFAVSNLLGQERFCSGPQRLRSRAKMPPHTDASPHRCSPCRGTLSIGISCLQLQRSSKSRQVLPNTIRMHSPPHMNVGKPNF
jgi:hypothetical protein